MAKLWYVIPAIMGAGIAYGYMALNSPERSYFNGIAPLNTPKPYGYSFDAIPDLSGKIVVVTGANSGIGLATARALAAKGATTYITCRSAAKCEGTLSLIRREYPSAKIFPIELELSSLKSVHAASEQLLKTIPQLDMLILNAGVMHTPYMLTEDGLEQQFAVNHLSHMYFTMRLMPLIKKASESGPATITVLSSAGHWHGAETNDVFLSEKRLNDPEHYSPTTWYGNSKLCNILFARELAARVKDLPIYVNVLNPGSVSTNLGQHHAQRLTKYVSLSTAESILDTIKNLLVLTGTMWTPEQACMTPLYLATSPDVPAKNLRGGFYVQVARKSESSDIGLNAELGRQLWAWSEELLSARGYSI